MACWLITLPSSVASEPLTFSLFSSMEEDVCLETGGLELLAREDCEPRAASGGGLDGKGGGADAEPGSSEGLWDLGGGGGGPRCCCCCGCS